MGAFWEVRENESTEDVFSTQRYTAPNGKMSSEQKKKKMNRTQHRNSIEKMEWRANASTPQESWERRRWQTSRCRQASTSPSTRQCGCAKSYNVGKQTRRVQACRGKWVLTWVWREGWGWGDREGGGQPMSAPLPPPCIEQKEKEEDNNTAAAPGVPCSAPREEEEETKGKDK